MPGPQDRAAPPDPGPRRDPAGAGHAGVHLSLPAQSAAARAPHMDLDLTDERQLIRDATRAFTDGEIVRGDLGDPAADHRPGGDRDQRAGLTGRRAMISDTMDVLDVRSAAAEVDYAVVESPIGELLLAATDRGLVRVAMLAGGPEPVFEELARSISPRLAERPRRLAAARRELEEYFAGRRRRFEAPQDLRRLAGFRLAVLEATAAIAYGEVSSYAEVARAAGQPLGARAAGGALGSNPLAIVIPCHRVLRTGGGLGGFGGGLERKRFLLELEGALPPAFDLA